MALYLFNYDVEFEWAGDPAQEGHNTIPWHLLNRQALLLWPLMSEGDELAVYQRPDPKLVASLAPRLGFEPQWLEVASKPTNRIAQDLWGQVEPGSKELVPWGNSPSVDRLAGREVDPIGARFFSKLFFHQLRPPEFAPHSAMLDDPDWVEPMLKQALKDWGTVMVKHPWGSSGQKNLKITKLTQKTVTTLRRWVLQAGGILVEAYHQINQEWSLQYQLEPTGPRLLGVSRLYVAGDGSHQASGAGAQPPTEIKPLLAAAEAMLQIYFQEGFRGPLGIDVWESEGKFYLSELNPRLTMGRLALEWSKVFGVSGRLDVNHGSAVGPGWLVNLAACEEIGKTWVTKFLPDTDE